MSKEGEQIHFNNDFRKFEAPYVMYADFECTMEYSSKTSKPIRPNKPYTDKYQRHKPCGYNIYVVNRITNERESYLYRGPECMEYFVKTCRNIYNKMMNELKVNVPIIMTEEDEENFKNATHCYLCEGEIEDNNHIRRGCTVRDHCHMTGKYRGCAYNICNLHFNNKYLKSHVFFHNLKGYDSHFIVCNAHGFQSKARLMS